ncbi:MAG: ATPase [Alphaproteobacteria bacterium]|nr:ATPase [Alphaproteobacteria bacterium]
MKRFYKEVSVEPLEGGCQILLDRRPVRTPARMPLSLPSLALADAIADEWRRQGEKIDPRTMPLTGLANAAIDRILPDPAAFARGLAAYGESDLLCYRAEGPAPLIAREERLWDPLLAWARHRFDVDFETTSGILHRPQPKRTIEQLARAVTAMDPFVLAALSPLVTISGSLVIALALAEGAIDLDTAWAAATVDESWQAEKWGEDAEASARHEARRKEFAAAHRLLGLLEITADA